MVSSPASPVTILGRSPSGRRLVAEAKRDGDITGEIIGTAIEVHRLLGPGLLESTYQSCLAWELRARGLDVVAQKPLPVIYKGNRIDCGYRIDLLVEGDVIVEIKSVQRIDRIHEAQVLSYLRLSGCRVGLLVNFNVRYLRDGIRRLVNEYPGSHAPGSPGRGP